MRHLPSLIRQQALGFTALCVALSGTAYAATALPKNSVTSATVKNASLTTADVKNGTLLKEDFRAGQLSAGSGSGAAGPIGAKGDPGTNGTNGTNGVNGTNGANGSGATGAAGATGATGVAGAIGPTGATGAAGPARVSGRIDGTAGAARTAPPAVGLGSVTKVGNPPTTPVAYCITTTVGLTPANAVMLASPDSDGTTAVGTAQVDGDGSAVCPSPNAFVVRTFDKNGDSAVGSFVVTIP